jgi:hypothetical protein
VSRRLDETEHGKDEADRRCAREREEKRGTRAPQPNERGGARAQREEQRAGGETTGEEEPSRKQRFTRTDEPERR